MDMKHHLLDQINMHPSTEPQDIVKQCYQAAFGAEHLLKDTEASKRFLQEEYTSVTPQDMALYEVISDEVCRVNLAAWKHRGLPLSWLLRMFVSSACAKENSASIFADHLKAATELVTAGQVGFDLDEWQSYLDSYKAAGMPAVHHSDRYRECETPAYRIVSSRYIRLFPILEKAFCAMSEKPVCVIAIDGRAASGKSTMADLLQAVLDAAVIRMDDFFLPPVLRTEERLHTPGGNIHHERFLTEVLPHLSSPQEFSYRVFDCGRMDYNGVRTIESKPFRVVEGSYSCHPLFGHYADVSVFSQVTCEEQRRRILLRNGTEMAEIFQTKWIPLEEAYFEAFSVLQKCDLRV